MGIAAYNRGSASLIRPFQEASDHARYVEESFRLQTAADAALDFVRGVRTALAEIQCGEGIAACQRRAYLNCHVGRSRMDKFRNAENAWRDAYGQRPVAFAALRMRKAAEYLMAWIP